MGRFHDDSAGNALAAPLLVLAMSVIAVLLLAGLVIGDAATLEADGTPPPAEEQSAPQSLEPALELRDPAGREARNAVWM